jgi:hypothetical protein
MIRSYLPTQAKHSLASLFLAKPHFSIIGNIRRKHRPIGSFSFPAGAALNRFCPDGVSVIADPDPSKASYPQNELDVMERAVQSEKASLGGA